MYYDIRYISRCEASLMIFSYDIKYKHPSIERQSFHLSNKQKIILSHNGVIENIVNCQTIGENMFLDRFDAHNEYP